MIIKNTETLRKYLSINGSVEIENLQPYIIKAERQFLKPLIGKATITLFEEEQTDTVIEEAKKLAQEAVANFAYYLYLPIGAVQITDSGIHVTNNDNTRAASDKQFKELQRSFKKAGHEALDEMLEVMEQSPDIFTDWVASGYFTVYRELLVHKTSLFDKYYGIFNSRQTFVALRPNIRICEDRFLKSALGAPFIDAIKEAQTDEHRIAVQTLLQQSEIAFTVMLTVDNGMFILDANGMHMKFDVLPYEKSVTNVNLKVNEFLLRTKQNKQVEGEEYLAAALKIIADNPSVFPEYVTPDEKATLKLYTTKSIVGM